MLKDIYPEYQDSVDLYAVNIDLGEDLSSIVRFRDEQDHPWPVAQAPAEMLPLYNPIAVPFKVAIDGNGIVAFRGKGADPAEILHHVFQELSQV